VSINRPDRPLRSTGAQHRGRDHDHPDRKADLQERSDGAHAEYVTPPQAEPGQMSTVDDDVSTISSTCPDIPQRHDAPSELPVGPHGPGSPDAPVPSPGSAQVDAGPGPRGESPKLGAMGIAIVLVVVLPALIYFAMIAGVFTVGG